MGEVHHADDAEDHRVADGDEAVDGPERDSVDELLDENCHASAAPRKASPLANPAARATNSVANVLTGHSTSGNGGGLRRIDRYFGNRRDTCAASPQAGEVLGGGLRRWMRRSSFGKVGNFLIVGVLPPVAARAMGDGIIAGAIKDRPIRP